MRDSGYPERMRAQIIQSGQNRYNKMKETKEWKKATRSVNRLRSFDKWERRKEHMKKRLNWYKNNKYSTVLFVPCTPRSTLAQQLKDVEVRRRQDRKCRVKIVEKSGQTLRSQLSKSDPWAGEKFGKATCFPCRKSGGRNCRRKNIGYRITCEECYHSETSRNMFTRGEEHPRAINNKTRDSVI